MKHLLIGLVALSLSSFARADEVPTYGFTPEQNKAMAQHNGAMALFEKENPTLFKSAQDPLSFSLLDSTDVRPYAEYEKAGYLIFSSDFPFSSKKAKLAMAKNLPESTRLVVYTQHRDSSEQRKIRKTFADVIDESRLHIVHIPKAHKGFWARDAVPVPVWRWETGAASELTVVGAKYFHRFEPDETFADLFSSHLTEYDYYFEGGNFIANAKNDCLVVNKNQTKQIPDSIFKRHYGCDRLVRLPYVKGIGHADESVKFVDNNTVLTDEESYVSLLEAHGFNVLRLPRPRGSYETYVNSLIVNGVIYVPIFDEKNDEKALDVYRSLGFDKVIGLNSEKLSNGGKGSLHCITMTYPDVPLTELLESLGATAL